MSPDTISKCVELFERFVVAQERMAIASERIFAVQRENYALRKIETEFDLGKITLQEATSRIGELS